MSKIMKAFFVSLPLLPMIFVAQAQDIDDTWTQAQTILQQAADETMHYAITGMWDEDEIVMVMGYTIPDGLDKAARRAFVLDQLVPCTAGFDNVFFNHWGRDCEPGNHSDDDLRGSIARLISVAVFARSAAAELNPTPGFRIAGLELGNGELNTETVSETEPDWFHVWMCSERRTFSGRRNSRRYHMTGEGTTRQCELVEGRHTGENQYDLGGDQCEKITIILFYNQPQANGDYVQLEASASGHNECYRPVRVRTLPPQLAGIPMRTSILYRNGIVLDK